MAEIVVGVIHFLIACVLVLLVLLHSGRDSGGLSGMGGVGGGGGGLGTGALVEKNLDRWTIGFALAFLVTTISLIKL